MLITSPLQNRELFTCHTVEGIRRLVKAGAKLDERRGGDGSTPLLLHAGTGNHDVVAELVRLRANVDLQDHAGVSALMKSATAGHLEIVQSLIVAGAVLDLKNKEVCKEVYRCIYDCDYVYLRTYGSSFCYI